MTFRCLEIIHAGPRTNADPDVAFAAYARNHHFLIGVSAVTLESHLAQDRVPMSDLRYYDVRIIMRSFC